MLLSCNVVVQFAFLTAIDTRLVNDYLTYA